MAASRKVGREHNEMHGQRRGILSQRQRRCDYSAMSTVVRSSLSRHRIHLPVLPVGYPSAESLLRVRRVVIETMLESLEENSEEMDDACVFQGEGWKLGVNSRPADQSRSTSDYAAFVSGSDWSISLSHDEYRDFVHLLKSLRSHHLSYRIHMVLQTRGCNTGSVWRLGRRGI